MLEVMIVLVFFSWLVIFLRFVFGLFVVVVVIMFCLIVVEMLLVVWCILDMIRLSDDFLVMVVFGSDFEIDVLMIIGCVIS